MNATVETPLVAEIPVLRISPPSRWWLVPFSELWAYRELIYFFVWRDIKIRYISRL
jgi:lipopolysaccharide transport system permease protein